MGLEVNEQLDNHTGQLKIDMHLKKEEKPAKKPYQLPN